MSEKIGASLKETNLFDVTIIGYPSTSGTLGIQAIPLPTFKRLSFKRLLVPWIIFRKINEVKPEIVIINTPELLFIAALQRIFFGRKIVYDVLENYYRTVAFTTTYPPIIRQVLAMYVRLNEIIFKPFVSQFVFAEQGYTHEISFSKSPIVVQNKLPKSIAIKYRRKVEGNSNLIFTGTLAESTGVFEAIRLCKGLHEVDPSWRLTIIGYCSVQSTLAEIIREIEGTPFIKLIGGDKLVPHSKILEEISESDFGIIIYPKNPATASSIATKLYEYLALQLPIVIQHNEVSHKMVEDYGAGIVLESNPDYKTLSQNLKTFIMKSSVPEAVYWESEVENLINCLKLP